MLPELELRPFAEFDRFNAAEEPDQEDDHLYAYTLVQVASSGRLEHHYRVAFGGNTRLKASFTASSVSPHLSLKDYTFTLEEDPADINMRQNCFSSKWADLEDLVASGRIRVSLPSKADAEAEFRATWGTLKKADKPPAAALRWAASGHPAYGYRVALQTLPATAKQLRRDARLDGDGTRAVDLATWVAATKMETGAWNGPVPILFTKDAVPTQASLRKHPEKFLTGMPNCLSKPAWTCS